MSLINWKEIINDMMGRIDKIISPNNIYKVIKFKEDFKKNPIKSNRNRNGINYCESYFFPV